MRKAAIISVLVVLIGTALAIAQVDRKSASPGPKWEYLVESFKGDEGFDFNQRGMQGWELIAVTPEVQPATAGGGRAGKPSYAYFKRLKQN